MRNIAHLAATAPLEILMCNLGKRIAPSDVFSRWNLRLCLSLPPCGPSPLRFTQPLARRVEKTRCALSALQTHDLKTTHSWRPCHRRQQKESFFFITEVLKNLLGLFMQLCRAKTLLLQWSCIKRRKKKKIQGSGVVYQLFGDESITTIVQAIGFSFSTNSFLNNEKGLCVASFMTVYILYK